jgi:hypothetical protein
MEKTIKINQTFEEFMQINVGETPYSFTPIVEEAPDSFSHVSDTPLLRMRCRALNSYVQAMRNVAKAEAKARKRYEAAVAQEALEIQNNPVEEEEESISFPSVEREIQVMTLDDLVSAPGYERKDPDIVEELMERDDVKITISRKQTYQADALEDSYAPDEPYFKEERDVIGDGRVSIKIDDTNLYVGVELQQDERVEVQLVPVFRSYYSADCLVSLSNRYGEKNYHFMLENSLFLKREMTLPHGSYMTMTDETLEKVFENYKDRDKEEFMEEQHKHLQAHIDQTVDPHSNVVWDRGIVTTYQHDQPEHFYEDLHFYVRMLGLWYYYNPQPLIFNGRSVLPLHLWYEKAFVRAGEMGKRNRGLT